MVKQNSLLFQKQNIFIAVVLNNELLQLVRNVDAFACNDYEITAAMLKRILAVPHKYQSVCVYE